MIYKTKREGSPRKGAKSVSPKYETGQKVPPQETLRECLSHMHQGGKQGTLTINEESLGTQRADPNREKGGKGSLLAHIAPEAFSLAQSGSIIWRRLLGQQHVGILRIER